MIIPGIMAACRFTSGGSSGGGGDPYFGNVVSLLHFDGSFADVKGKTWTPINGATTTATYSVFGGSSGNFLASNAQINSGITADFNFGTGDFTIEGWIRPNFLDQIRYIYWFPENPQSLMNVDSNKRVTATVGGSPIHTAGNSINTGTWYHVALSRTGATIRFFLDGIQAGSIIDAGLSMGSNNSSMRYAQANNAPRYFAGQLDEWRITKGVGRYTANFTVPTAPYPDS